MGISAGGLSVDNSKCKFWDGPICGEGGLIYGILRYLLTLIILVFFYSWLAKASVITIIIIVIIIKIIIKNTSIFSADDILWRYDNNLEIVEN